MIDSATQSLELLVKIYIGQNIRNEGILQSEVKEKDQTAMLLSKALISENHWYLGQFKTSEKGSEIASAIVKRRIEEKREQLRAKLSKIPKRALGFFVKRYVSKDLALRASKPTPFYPVVHSWEECILADSRIWILWDELFAALEFCGLCVKTHYYVATRGGELRGLCYVISPETREFLIEHFSSPDFSPEQENAIRIYAVFKRLDYVLSINDVDSMRQQYYQLLKDASVSEEQLAGIVDATNKVGITSEYHGLLSKGKPFEISDVSRFRVYLDQNLLQPAVNILLQEKSEIQTLPARKTTLAIEEQVEDVIRKGESETLEFKSALTWDYKLSKQSKEIETAIAKTLCAFMNSKGGTLIIGVDDTGQIIGLEKDFLSLSKRNRDGFEQKLIGLVNSFLGKENAACVHLSWQDVEKKSVAIVKVDRSKRPVYLDPQGKSEFYIRAGNSSQPLNVREATAYIQDHWPEV
jgi:hypothetical protein